MNRQTPMLDDPAVAARRKSARRTAWVIAAIAVAIYAGFLLLGVVGR